MPRQYLDDAFGPDGVRVSIAVETAIDQLVRVRRKGFLPTLLPGLTRDQGWTDDRLQEHLFQGEWVVDVESDSGDRIRRHRPDRDSAVELAKRIWRDVTERGLAALDEL